MNMAKILGLEQYVEKHGNHFTEALALDVTINKYKPESVSYLSEMRFIIMSLSLLLVIWFI